MELHFQIEKQELKRIDRDKPADFSSEYLQCHFDFLSDDWDDFGKFAIFRVKDKNYRVAIAEGLCTVPFDALKGNRFILTVYGVKDDVRITTNYVWIHLKDSAFVDEYDESSYFNPDMTEELLDLVETKTDKTVFNETVSNLEDSIATKTDKSLFDETVETINNSIFDLNSDISNLDDTKTDKSLFNDTISDLEDSISNLDSVKVDTSVFSETVEDINDSISEMDTNKTVSITKQATADTGYFSTYVLNQGGTALSPKINIPKDYLLKSASIEQCSEQGVPLHDLEVGDYYFDFVLNTKDDTGEDSHLYLNAKVLTDVYEGDGETIVIEDGIISVKDNVFALKSHTHSKSDISDFSHTHSKSDILDFYHKHFKDQIVDFAHTHTKSDISDFAHNHDDRYYTETETDTLLDSKSDTGHTHTEADITDLQNYALESEVYSKAEVDALIHDLNNNIKINSTEDIIQTDETLELYAYAKSNGKPVINKKIHFYEVKEE